MADVLDDAFVLSARRAADAFASADAGRGVSRRTAAHMPP